MLMRPPCASNDYPRNVQPQPQPAHLLPAAPRSVEALKHTPDLVLRYAYPFVSHGDCCHVDAARQIHVDRLWRKRVLQRVRDEVDHSPFNTIGSATTDGAAGSSSNEFGCARPVGTRDCRHRGGRLPGSPVPASVPGCRLRSARIPRVQSMFCMCCELRSMA